MGKPVALPAHRADLEELKRLYRGELVKLAFVGNPMRMAPGQPLDKAPMEGSIK